MSHQEQLACAWTAGNCFDEAKILEKRIKEIKDEIQKNTNGSPEEVKKLDKKLQDAIDDLKSNTVHLTKVFMPFCREVRQEGYLWPELLLNFQVVRE